METRLRPPPSGAEDDVPLKVSAPEAFFMCAVKNPSERIREGILFVIEEEVASLRMGRRRCTFAAYCKFP
jgi:hypothetical protein